MSFSAIFKRSPLALIIAVARSPSLSCLVTNAFAPRVHRSSTVGALLRVAGKTIAVVPSLVARFTSPPAVVTTSTP